MKICLINPPYANDPGEDADYYYTGFTLPHLGLGYIASYLSKHGHEVDIFECMGQGMTLSDIYNKIENNEYQMIGLSIYESNRKSSFKILTRITRRKPSLFVVAGGYTATLSCEQLLKGFPILKCCILGEGEKTMLELANRLSHGESFQSTPGICYIDGQGSIIKSKSRDLIQNLDELPYPVRTFMNRQKMISMITSRGCKGNCIYCAIITFYRTCNGNAFRNRSAANIVSEIEALIEEYSGIHSICFFDDNFFENTPENDKKLTEMIQIFREKGLYVPFSITVCVKDLIRQQHLLPAFKEIGLYKVFIGVESFCQRQLDFYNKDITVSENIQAISILQNNGLEISLGFIAFDPYVSIDEIETNFKTLKEMNVINTGLSPFSMHTYLIAVRNTALMNWLTRNNLYINNEKGYQFSNPTVEEICNLINQWNESTMPLITKSYHIEKAQERGIQSAYVTLKQLYIEFIELDINYILALCTAVKDGLRLINIYDDYINRYKIIYREYIAISKNNELLIS